jgi:hypothetical protein
MRADAQKNRQRLLDAENRVDPGSGRRIVARCNCRTRRGRNRNPLLTLPGPVVPPHAVARHALERSISAGEAIFESVLDGVVALRQYMHAALDNGIGVVNMIHPLLEKRDWPDLLSRAAHS